MRGEIAFINSASRLAAARVGLHQYLVFEYGENESFNEGEVIDNLTEGFAKITCQHRASGGMVEITVLSSTMSQDKAKLVVAPWKQVGFDNDGLLKEIA